MLYPLSYEGLWCCFRVSDGTKSCGRMGCGVGLVMLVLKGIGRILV